MIGERPDPRDVPDNWLSMHVHAAEELPGLVARLDTIKHIHGIHVHGDVERIWDGFRAAYRFVQAAGGAVTDEKGRLLLIHRLGRWDLPKGKVESGEAVDVGAVREVQEECGLREVRLIAPLCHTWHTYQRTGAQYLKRTDWFLMEASSAERLTAQQEEDIDEVRWMDRAEVAAIRGDIYPSLLPVLNAWERRDRA